MSWRRYGCCGNPVGFEHAVGCEDALTPDERQEGELLAAAAEREAREFIEASA